MENNASKITEWYEEKVKDEFQPLFKRHDEDFELWDTNPTPSSLTAYELDVKAKTKEHGSDIDVVSNELRTNCDNVQSILSSAGMQIIVRMTETEGVDPREEIGKFERLLYFLLEQGDLRLRQLLLPSLRESSDWHALVRGWRAARILNYKGRKGKVIANYTALDPRWLVYDVGDEGLLKVGYKAFKSQASLKSEWEYDAEKKKDNEVIDYWEFEKPYEIWNSVVCKDVFLKDPELYKIRSMPFSIVPVSTRPPIAGTTGLKLKGYGDSIFASARNINAIRNRFASVVANHANRLANQALINYKTAQGVDVTSTSNVPGGVLNLPMGENKLEPSPMPEISPTVVNMLNWLGRQIEATLLPKFQVEEPPASGTRYALATEAANKTFNPQVRSLNHFMEDICRLIEEQLIDGGIKVKFQSLLRDKYDEVEVTPVDLKKPHIIKVEFTARTPWEQLDTAQVADMLRRSGVPEGWIWENIYKFQDPKGMQDLAAIELFEKSPEGAMITAWKALKKQERHEEAERLEEHIYNLAMSERWGTSPPTPEAEVGAGT